MRDHTVGRHAGGMHDQHSRRRFGGAPRTAFVLSGGASLGAMQAGMLRALYERGIAADVLIATSAGGLNAAFVASRPQTVATAKALGEVWCELRRPDVFPVHMPTIFGASDQPRRSPRALQAAAAPGGVPPNDRAPRGRGGAPAPRRVRPARRRRGASVARTGARRGPGGGSDPGRPAAGAVGDYLLADGGVVNNTPISHAIELGAERIFVLSASDPNERGLPTRPRGPLDALVQACRVLVGARLEADLMRYADEAELIILSAANRTRVQPNDFDQAELLIAQGLRAARRQLDAGVARAALAA